MGNLDLYRELEVLYRRFMELGDTTKAADILMKMTDLKMKAEGSNDYRPDDPRDVLLG